MRVSTALPIALAIIVSCGPEDGPAGADANQFLTSVADEPPGDNCDDGGVKIDYGFDTDGDDALGDGEIVGTTYVCNGSTPDEVLVTDTAVFEPGGGCRDGYQVIEFGVDNGDDGGTASDGVLQPGEVDGTLVECLPPDVDEDGARNLMDNCPELANGDQADEDLDFQGDACDTSSDPFELWAIDNGGTLYLFDVAGGTYTEVGDIGYEVTNIAVNPADGELYGYTRSGASEPYLLVRIDTTTGAGTQVAEHYYEELDGGEGLHIGALAFLSDGSLYGISTTTESLVQLDMVGGYEVVGAYFDPWRSGLCALPDDRLLGFSSESEVFTIEPGVGAASLGVLDGGGDGLQGADLNPDTMAIAGVQRSDDRFILAHAYDGHAPPLVYYTVEFDEIVIHSVAFVED